MMMIILTYLLTPRCRVLLEKLTGLQLVKKFPEFYGTRRFITALTSVRHLSLSCASPIQSTYPHPTSWRSILILSTHLRLGLPSQEASISYNNNNKYSQNRPALRKNKNETIMYRQLYKYNKQSNICGAHSGVAKDPILLKCCTALIVNSY